MSASSALPGLDMMPANLWVDAALAMVRVELYRNSSKKTYWGNLCVSGFAIFAVKSFYRKGRKEIRQTQNQNWAYNRNSRFPSPPRIGESITSVWVHPRASNA